MLRNFRRTAAAQPSSAARTKMTGFSLFTQDLQKEKRVLRADSFKSGHANMRVMSALWRQLPVRRRAAYNERALQLDALEASDPEKKHNTFNLLMRLFSTSGTLLQAGDGAFTALLAKSTMRALSAKDTARLKAKLQVQAFCTSKQRSYESVTSEFLRFANPSMTLFDSFTDMQHSVAPTRQCAFAALTRMLFVRNVTVSGEEYVMKRYDTLSPQLRNVFAPISDVEAPFFETYCALRCGSFDRRRFDIMRLFAAFRGIEIDLGGNAAQHGLYRSLLNSDRSRDGIFFRARRTLERLEARRSSDCGCFIASRLSPTTKIDPTTYGISSSLDDVSVATMLAETRDCQSVYDDVLTRAAVLRPRDRNRRLAVYQVATTLPTEAVSNRNARVATVMEAIKEVPHELTAKPALKMKVAQTRHSTHRAAAARAVVRAKARRVEAAAVQQAKRAQPASMPAPKQQRLAAAPARKAVALPRGASRKSRTQPARPQATLAATAAAAPARRRLSPATNKRSAGAKAKAAAKPATAALRTAPAAVKAAVKAADESGGDSADVYAYEEDFMAAEEEDEAELAEVPEAAEDAAPAPAVAEPASPAKTKRASPVRRRGSARHLITPEALLPATAMRQKMITRHMVRRRKTLAPTSAPHATAFTPSRRKISFADNIRAQLASFL